MPNTSQLQGLVRSLLSLSRALTAPAGSHLECLSDLLQLEPFDSPDVWKKFLGKLAKKKKALLDELERQWKVDKAAIEENADKEIAAHKKAIEDIQEAACKYEAEQRMAIEKLRSQLPKVAEVAYGTKPDEVPVTTTSSTKRKTLEEYYRLAHVAKHYVLLSPNFCLMASS